MASRSCELGPCDAQFARTFSRAASLAAVLEDALEIHGKYVGLPGLREQRLLAEVEQWLVSDDTQ